MDSQVLVAELIDAGAEFVRRFDQVIPVKVAFWLNEADAGEWRLYLVSDAVTDWNLGESYGEVLRITGEMRNPNLDPFQVRLLSPDKPLARAALDVLGLYRGPMPYRSNGPVFGGIGIEGVYIYPPLAAVSG